MNNVFPFFPTINKASLKFGLFEFLVNNKNLFITLNIIRQKLSIVAFKSGKLITHGNQNSLVLFLLETSGSHLHS